MNDQVYVPVGLAHRFPIAAWIEIVVRSAIGSDRDCHNLAPAVSACMREVYGKSVKRQPGGNTRRAAETCLDRVVEPTPQYRSPGAPLRVSNTPRSTA